MKIGIFGAEQKEIDLLKDAINGKKIKEVAGMKFFEGKISELSIVLVCSGIGKVNAALCCQILISEFEVGAILNTGTAGGLDENLNIFDIVVSTDAVQHDVNATEFGYRLGQIPMTSSPFWIADKKLKAQAIKAFKKLKELDENLKTIKMIEGRIASGDIFVTTKELRKSIIKNFDPVCTEMEGAAAAQVCVTNKIPYLIIRSISDTAGKTDSAKISYEEFSIRAAKISAMLVLEMIKIL